MADRDVKVTYKSRILPRDYDDSESDRPRRTPTALDPYGYPYEAGSLSRVKSSLERERGSSTNIYSANSVTAVDQARSSYARPSRGAPDDTDRRSTWRGHDAVEVDSRRDRGRPDEFILDRTVRKDGNTYIMDTRGEVEIVMPGRDQDPRPRYVYSYANPSQRRQYEDDYCRDNNDDRPAPEVVMLRRDITPPRQSRRDAERRLRDEDDDWRLVDKMRDTRISTESRTQGTRDRDHDRDRDDTQSRRQTQSSEDSYILVSPNTSAPPPPAQSQTSQTRQLRRRSSIRRTDYSPSETTHRRSRSISFRDNEVAYHDCGERRHERPGAEAVICGSYLRHYSSDDEGGGRREGGGGGYRDRNRDRGPERDGRGERKKDSRTEIKEYGLYKDDRYDRDRPYPPQQDSDSNTRSKSKGRRRSRSRKGRNDEERRDDDDESYYEERRTYTKKTTYL